VVFSFLQEGGAAMEELSIREIFPKRLLYYMRENGKNRNDIVRDLGFKYSTIRDWEKGLTVPRMDKVEMLANYFGCSNADLLEDKKEKPTVDDGLSDDMIKLIERIKTLPVDKVRMLLQVAESIK
jgi:transcriptional regulator with XRE-family HTH domain